MMKIKVKIGNKDREWTEDHDTNTAYFQRDMFDECETAEQYMKRMVQWFNNTLREGEKPRHFVEVLEVKK